MAYSARVFRVFIASPSDVQEERRIIVDVIQAWNDLHSADSEVVLLPLRWETHSAPELRTRPQEIINRDILENCDLLIGVFWTRIGSPTGKANSGTLEEIERVADQGKPCMLYFSNIPADPSSLDLGQLQKLKDFKEKTYPDGLVESYPSLNEFRDKISKQLAMKVKSLANNGKVLVGKDDELISQSKDLSVVDSIDSALRKIKERNDDLFYEQARESVIQLEIELRDAEQGRLLLDPSHSASFALTLAEKIESSLWATAMWGNDWRGGPLIKSTRDEYLRRLAVAKFNKPQIVMRRLFLIETGIEEEQDFIQRVREDTRDGVDVRYLHVQDWNPTPVVPAAEDFAIWDRSRVWYFTRTPTSTHHSNCATICVKDYRVSLYEHAFNTNWEAGTSVKHLLEATPE